MARASAEALRRGEITDEDSNIFGRRFGHFIPQVFPFVECESFRESFHVTGRLAEPGIPLSTTDMRQPAAPAAASLSLATSTSFAVRSTSSAASRAVRASLNHRSACS